jgi:hypothetical protein
MDDYDPVAPLCIYTIAHSDRLNYFYHLGGRGELFEGKRWVRATELFTAAQEFRMRLLVIFAAAEAPAELIYYGTLDAVRLRASGTEYTFSGLTSFSAPRPVKTTLVNDLTGAPIPHNYSRPYLICRTPKELMMKC